MNDGWIKLYRRIKDNWLYKEKRKFSRFEAWIDLLLEANHKDNRFPLGNKIVECKRGQIITSVRKLCDRWGWSNTKINNFLILLQNENMIAFFSDAEKTVITIENYDMYQNANDAETTQERRESDTKTTREHTNKNDKNVKNDKKNIISDYTSNEKLIEAINDFMEMRKKIKKPMTDKAISLMLKKLDTLTNDETKKIEILEQSIANSWQGVFPLKKDKPSTPNAKSFNNFTGRNYDTDELKKRLLAKSRGEKID